MEQEERCPIRDTHKRLHQTHLLWHQAEREYPNADSFVVNLNATITGLRSVTFVLQKEKSAIPDFDAWYESWRARLGEDKLMVWLKNARTRIEKMGDLKTNSMARISLLAGWNDPLPLLQESIDPLTTVERVLESVRRMRLSDQVRREGVILMERRWVVGELPERELLDVLAHCYAVTARLVVDAHRKCGMVMRTFRRDSHALRPARTEHLDGRLPCMVATDEMRTAIFHLGTGEFISISHEDVPVDPKVAEVRAARYGGKRGELAIKPGEDVLDAAMRWFEHAKKVLLSDGFHGSMMVLVMPGGETELYQLADHDRQTLYVQMRRMAREVERAGAVGVIHIGEFWHAPVSDLKPGQGAADAPTRKEALQVYAANSDDRRRIYWVEFSKGEGGKVDFGESVVDDDDELDWWGFMEPIRRVWKRWQAPDEGQRGQKGPGEGTPPPES